MRNLWTILYLAITIPVWLTGLNTIRETHPIQGNGLAILTIVALAALMVPRNG